MPNVWLYKRRLLRLYSPGSHWRPRFVMLNARDGRSDDTRSRKVYVKID